MLTLALTLTLSTLHLPPPSSLHLLEGQLAAPLRAMEIEKELSSIGTRWPTGSVVLTAVGFGGAGTFGLVGLAFGFLLGGLPGIFIMAIGLTTGGLTLMLGVAGVIWGAAATGASRERARKQEEEREVQADGRPQLERSQFLTLATF